MADNRWIFQANPSKYDIGTSLRREAEELWNCIQHSSKISAGDQVLIWISGKDAGIYATGVVLSDPVLREDSARGQKYWTDPRNGRQPRARVCVRYDRILVGNPLLRDYLKCDPELWDLSILANPRGTNFPVKDHEWHAIQGWLLEGASASA